MIEVNNAILACQLYIAIKLHFGSNRYDFHKYQGKVNISETSFLARKDKFYFYKLAKKYNTVPEYINFLVANFKDNPKLWGGDIVSDEAHDAFKKHQQVIESLSYLFSQNIDTLINLTEQDDIRLDQLICPNGMSGYHPTLLYMVMNNELLLETLIILNMLMGFFPYWDTVMSQDIIWPEWKLKCTKYQPFLNIDLPAYKKLVVDKIRNI